MTVVKSDKLYCPDCYTTGKGMAKQAAVWLPVEEYEPPKDGKWILVWKDGPDLAQFRPFEGCWYGFLHETEDEQPYFTHWSEIADPHEMTGDEIDRWNERIARDVWLVKNPEAIKKLKRKKAEGLK